MDKGRASCQAPLLKIQFRGHGVGAGGTWGTRGMREGLGAGGYGRPEREWGQGSMGTRERGKGIGTAEPAHVGSAPCSVRG